MNSISTNAIGGSTIGLGIYEHYKGGRVEVVAVAHHSETLEEMVVYKTRYENRSFGKGSYWVRPLQMFVEEVEFNGKKLPRFRYVGNEQ